MASVRRCLLAASMAASFSCVGCSSSSNEPATDGAHDGARPDATADGTGVLEVSSPYDPDGPYAACNDPLTQTATLSGTGFEAWEDHAVLGCFNPADPVGETRCDDAIVTGGAFTIMATVCTGNGWDVHIFDPDRGIDCLTTAAPVDAGYTVTPADCKCFSGALPSTGCTDQADGGADGDAGQDAADAAPDA
jgi:hypothetical protein